MNPKRIHTRSRPCGRANAVSAPRAAAWSRVAVRSCVATSRGSCPWPSITTSGPWRRTARPARSTSTAPSGAPPAAGAAPQPNATSDSSGRGTAAKSKSGWAGVASARGRSSRSCQDRDRAASASDAAPPGAAVLPAARGLVGRAAPRRRRPGVLLLPKHGVLHLLRQTELADALGRDLDGLPGLRIAADARLAIREHELSEPWKDEAVLRFLAREAEHLVEHAHHLLLGELGLLREVGNGLRLTHHFRHRFLQGLSGGCGSRTELIPRRYRAVKRNSPDAISRRYEPKRASAS